MFSLREENSSRVETLTSWIYEEELSNKTLSSAEAQGFFRVGIISLSNVSKGTGLHEALTLGSGFLKRMFESMWRREVGRHVSFNITMKI